MAQTREQLAELCLQVFRIHAEGAGLEVRRYPRDELLACSQLTSGQKHYMLLAQAIIWPEPKASA